MKDIITKINEGQDLSIKTTKNLIEALKSWYNEGVGAGKGSNSPYIKTFENLIITFVEDCIMSSDMNDKFKDDICDTYNLGNDTYEECSKKLIEYILK